MTLIINNVDFSPYIAYKGLKWKREDVEGKNSGILLNGDTIRDRLKTKKKLQVELIPVPETTARMLISALIPEYVTVTTDDLLSGRVTMTMFSEDTEADFCLRRNNEDYWEGISFELEMR